MTFVTILLVGTLGYAATQVGWGVTQAPKSVVNASCNKPGSRQAHKPGDVTVNIYNSSPKTGLAAAVAGIVARQGFKVATVANDPLSRTILGIGEIRHGQNGTVGAHLVAATLPGATLLEDRRTDGSVDLVVGNGYRVMTALTQPTLLRAMRLAPKVQTHC